MSSMHQPIVAPRLLENSKEKYLISTDFSIEHSDFPLPGEITRRIQKVISQNTYPLDVLNILEVCIAVKHHFNSTHILAMKFSWLSFKPTRSEERERM